MSEFQFLQEVFLKIRFSLAMTTVNKFGPAHVILVVSHMHKNLQMLKQAPRS